MKKITLLLFAMLTICSASAQETIKLTVSGEGATKEVATANALRSAIEQAFGTFVSANTQILNDEIVKDEIATISSGNIQEYKELSCITMPNGQQSVLLSATVSIGNLVSYAKSKGSTAEFAGATFAMNIKMRKLNAENETTALYNMLDQLYILAPSVFDWELDVGEPAVLPEQKYEVPMIAKAKTNKNTASFFSIIFNTLESLSLSPSEVEGYEANKMKVYNININDRKFIFRNDAIPFMSYLGYLINCIGESFHLYGQFGDQKAKLLYDLKEMRLADMRVNICGYEDALLIKNIDGFMNRATGSIVFQRNLSVNLDENALYQLYGFEVVPAPNISRISFVHKNGMMAVDKMEVYQSVDFWPYYHGCPCKDAFKHMRVLYVSEDCPVNGRNIALEGYNNLQTVTIERLSEKMGEIPPRAFANCENLETVRIGKGVKTIGGISFYDNPKLSTVIIGSTLTYGDDVIDLMSLTETDLQDIVIFGDGVTSIGETRFGKSEVSQKSLSVVFNCDISQCSSQRFYPNAKIVIWPCALMDNYMGFRVNGNLILVPMEHLSAYQKQYVNNKFYPLEDKMSELGCMDLLSFLKTLCQSDSIEITP